MADYIYLLENRLSRAQREALHQVREAARSHGLTVFLVGGAVRDLTSGAPIRDLDFAVQGDARVLSETLQSHGTLLGTHDLMQALFFSFPGGVRLEASSTLSVTYPKPGKPEVQSASLLEDLRRRDFTANAMAISLNEGSYGLLMDPTNGVADVENRELRLLSNYGFLEDPSRLIRATRLMARLGWQMEERTQGRYENAKAEGYMSALGEWERRYETEEIFREEDPLRVLRKLEAEGWVSVLTPALNSAKVNEAELDRMREIVGQLNTLGIYPDTSAAAFALLSAKLSDGDVSHLKRDFALPGFAGQIEALDGKAKALTAEFTGKSAAAASASWNLLMAAEPEAVLWMAFNSKSPAVQAKFKLFLTEWPHARQKLPYQQMQEMRITPDVPGYDALLDDLFFAVMDKKLDTPEAIKAFLEPFSPPAAPPPPTLRRRAVKRESKAPKSRAKKAVGVEETTAPDSPQAAASGEAAAAPVSQPAPVSKAASKAASKEVPVEAPAVPMKQTSSPAAPNQAESEPGEGGKPASKTPVKQVPVKKAAEPATKEEAPAVPVAAKASAGTTGKKQDAKKEGTAVAKKSVPAKTAQSKPAQGKAPAKAQGKVQAKAAAKGVAAKVAGKGAAKAGTKPVAKSVTKAAPAKAKKVVAAKAKGAPAKAKSASAAKGKAAVKGKSAKVAARPAAHRPAPKTAGKKAAAKGKRR